MSRIVCFLALAFCFTQPVLSADTEMEMENVLTLSMNSLDGESVDFQKYEGKVLLIVNVASRCGLTPQYDALQQIYSKYNEKGFEVLAFPCNQFGGQEPGTSEEIAEFCTEKYSVEFPMFEKINVNGNDACDLYKYLTSLELEPAGTGKITWNFEKFLVNQKGEVIHRFSPRTEPDSEEVVEAIEKVLAAE